MEDILYRSISLPYHDISYHRTQDCDQYQVRGHEQSGSEIEPNQCRIRASRSLFMLERLRDISRIPEQHRHQSQDRNPLKNIVSLKPRDDKRHIVPDLPAQGKRDDELQ